MMPRSLAHSNWKEEQGFHYEYDPPASFTPEFPSLTHMLRTDSGWGADTCIESRPTQSAQDFMSSDLITSTIGATVWGTSPMIYESSRATSVSAAKQHVGPNPRYTPYGDAAPFSSVDCCTSLASAADVRKNETSLQTRHPVEIAAKPGRPSQHRAIKDRSDLLKEYVAQGFTFNPRFDALTMLTNYHLLFGIDHLGSPQITPCNVNGTGALIRGFSNKSLR
ncbi:hypothetical protein N7494_005989 [Penicillium frequentans]|uniref:Uncharacterized protein n=1 Tax=Penicillium frequentans TaxID=3151616 RepID=A0AAD6CXT1_9EURO|nr:hypothetical protein N7494_005989 [Penicillium glabrum]